MSVLRDSLMYPDGAWNRRGPRLPHWFNRGLRAIDRNLTTQFLPPRPRGGGSKDGVDGRMFPEGVWVVAKRLPRSRMLCKKWVAVLGAPYRGYVVPTRRDLQMLKRARNMWRGGRLDEMSRALDRTISLFYSTNDDASKKVLSQRIVDTCRDLSITKRSLGVPVVSMHQSEGGSRR